MSHHHTQSNPTQPSSNQQTLTAPHAGSAGTTCPAHAEIARRAYEIYIHKGRRPGQCEKNWLQAEQELRTPASASR